MATYYVKNGGDGGDPNTDPSGIGDDWSGAIANLDLAFDSAGATDIIKISDAHNHEYSATISYASAGTLVSPVNVYSVADLDTSVYSIGALDNAGIDAYHITFTGFANVHGVLIKSGNNMTFNAANITWQFIDSHLEMTGTSAGDVFGPGAFDGAVMRLINTDLTFGIAGQGMSNQDGTVFEWFGGELKTDQINLIKHHQLRGGIVRIRGVDLSVLDVNGNATGFFNGFGGSGDAGGFYGEIIGCKLHATPPPLTTDNPPAIDGVYLAMIGCGSAGIPQTHIHMSQGDVYHETSVVRIAEYDGTNKYSYKMIPNANIDFHTPLRFKLCEQWMAADPIITAHFTHDINGDGSDAQNNEVWLEIEHPNDTVPAYRQWDRTSRMAILGTPADLTTPGGVDGWTNGAGAYNSIAVTPNSSAGVHTVWVCSAIPVAKAETLYACSKVVVT